MQGVVLNPTYSRPHQTLDPPSCSRPASKVQFFFFFLLSQLVFNLIFFKIQYFFRAEY